MKIAKCIVITILNLITLPIVFLSIMVVPFTEPDSLETIHCFGNCIYQIHQDDGLYKYDIDKKDWESIRTAADVIKYKDDKNSKDAYIIVKDDNLNSLFCILIKNKNRNASLYSYECEKLPDNLKKQFDDILESSD